MSVGATTQFMSYKRVDLDRLPYIKRREEAAQIIASSSSWPMYYQALEYENELLMAGTLKKSIDIDSAIERCMEIVSHESDIVVDVILMSSVGREVLTKSD